MTCPGCTGNTHRIGQGRQGASASCAKARRPTTRKATLTDPLKTAERIDYDAVMRANLAQVFAEPDAKKRLTAIQALYAEDAALIEPHASARGHVEINEAVSTLLAGLPPDFVFQAAGPAVGHHGVGRLLWRSGPLDGPPAVTGMDVAHVQGGVIRCLYVFLDPRGA